MKHCGKRRNSLIVIEKGDETWIHGENADALGMVPLIFNPIYTLYSGYLLGISPMKGLLGGLKGYHPNCTSIFPMMDCRYRE